MRKMGSTVSRQQVSVVTLSTIAFTVCFAVWMMFAVIGIPIKKMLDLNETQFGLLAATPVLTGSLIRLPLGIWTDKFGGRIVFFLLMLSTVAPIWLIGEASEFWQFLVLGLFVGLAGGSFSVGIAYCARWFDTRHQGFAMGIFGAGNSGAAVTKFVAPAILVAYGWTMVPKVYSVAMFVTALAFWFFTYTDPAHVHGKHVTLRDQLKALKDPNVWKLCQYYSIVFGGYVALSLWMTKYYVTEYGFAITSAALLAAHPVTWWVMLMSWVCLFFLSYPQADIAVRTAKGDLTFHVGLNVYVFTFLMFLMGIAWAIGKASVFKYISDEYTHNIGVVSGIVGLAGGLGGFLLPIMFGALVDVTGVQSSIFMLMWGITLVSLVWMYWTEIVPLRTRQRAARLVERPA
jgi:NNP family nitrate/nitrite transporter-like MFS transporter